jgi:predicted NBD/HSP70 family sugar kinase
MFKGFDAILAVDIGGTNIRAGVVEPNLKKASDLSKAAVWKFELWRHGDEKLKREEAVERLVEMLEKLIARAEKEKYRLAPFIGIGCPGIIEADGSIDRGAQNLPGNWESSRFNLPALLVEAIPTIGEHETSVLMHNDAVVQGLSEVPFMQDVTHWGALTIGTGLGNVRFTNRAAEK